MTLVHLHRFHAVARIALGAAALLAVSAAWAQVTTQNLTIGFQAAGFLPGERTHRNAHALGMG